MADIVGFSRLMGRDEEGTTSRVLDFHEQVRIKVESHGGRVVGTAGDSVFGDFDSVIEALGCAGTIQQGLHSANRGLPAEERIDARIGLHLGDVIVEEYNVFGDGVNIAARLEQLADPGGIVLSEAVYQQVRGRSDWPITEIGTKSLKNIREPIRLFRIGPEAFGEGAPPPQEPTGSEPSTTIRQSKEETIRAVRELIMDSIKEASDAAGEAGPASSTTVIVGKGRRRLAAVLGPATLVLLAIGVLLVMARFSGWTENGWYPFAGLGFVGLSVGMMVEGATGRDGFQLLFQSLGVAGGAVFIDGVVLQAVMWVIAVSMFGTALQSLLRR